MFILLILFIFLSYITGAVPFGLIIGRKQAGIDITRKGSGNIGATNVARELGIKWGLLTLILDLLKGFIPVFIARNFITEKDGILLIAVSIAVLLGHRYSIFLYFKGGKAVATALGIFLAISPVATLLSIIVFIVTVYLSDYISLGSIAGACSMPVILSLLDKNSPASSITAFLTALIILITHKENLVRIIKGKERKWKNRHL